MPSLRPLKLGTLLLSVGLTAQAFSWNAVGHMVVCDIALRNLTPTAKAEVERLIKINAPERSPDFISAGPWADDTRTRENGSWHFIDTYFRADGKETDLKPDKENVVWAIDKFSKVLADKSASDADRGQALRYLEHFVGDIHQPLHCSSRVTDAQPKGDAGGNRFYLEDPKQVQEGSRPHNLHSLWDGGCGAFTMTVRRPIGEEGKATIDKLADECLAALTDDDKKAVKDVTTPEAWAQDGFNVAKTVVYNTPENTKPSKDYMKTGKNVSERRVAEAGLRLAALLNQLLDPAH